MANFFPSIFFSFIIFGYFLSVFTSCPAVLVEYNRGHTLDCHCAQLEGDYLRTMASYLSRLSPIPSFPDYTGPHKVGTIDVEIAVSELESPCPSPDESISTVQYRIFYPCEPEFKAKTGISWIPQPQRGYVSAYSKFLGAGSMLANLIS